ncbi:MAG: DJ-1/PfpI family protein [Coriobacteriia bacterium]|jgi:protease I|nr:DJ-1/PfpI family protein [Coriobacteriia bacterium]
MKNVLMVIAPRDFRDEEYAHPKQVLESRGARVVTASTTPGPCIGKLGMHAEATLAVSDADALDYDAVVFIGGAGSAVFFDDPYAQALARAARVNKRVLAAICIAPSVLAHAGLLAGVEATAFESQKEDLEKHGAIWTGEPVTVDGLVITANGPDAAWDFGNAIADALGI